MKTSKKPSKSLMEKETIVRLSEESDEPMTVYTHRRGLAARMKRFGAEVKGESKIDGKVVAWTFTCPSSWFRAPRKPRPRGLKVAHTTSDPHDTESPRHGDQIQHAPAIV